MILVYVTCGDESEAKSISRHLLNKRLVACVNIFPIESMYWWEDKISEEREFVIIAKTIDEKFNNIKEEIGKVHSYSAPCILKIDANANEKFMKWIKEEIKK